MKKTISVRRRTISYLTAGGFAAAGAFVLAAPSVQADVMEPGDKVWVCKYVGTPGVNETLKEGKNPIEVSWNSIPNDNGEVNVGDRFADAQGNSIVVQIKGNDPGVEACPAPQGPSETTTTTAAETTTTTAAETTTTTAAETTTTTSGTTTTTSPAVTTTTTTPAKTTTTTTAGVTPPANEGGTPPPAGTPGTTGTPGIGAPQTGGAGEPNPANGIIGSGFLLAAAGVLGAETLRRRRESLNA